MEFVNHTPFPALAFEGIDQFDQSFHVVALRQTLTWGADGLLIYAEDQEPLCEVDEYFGTLNRSSLRQESDLCHYKPKCDVIVNATAYPPSGTSPRNLTVRLVLSLPDTPTPRPERPQGLNQFVEPDVASLAKWQVAVEHAQAHQIPGRRLIDKTLTVTGERELVRHIWPIRAIAAVVRACSLGLFTGGQWRLTSPKPINAVPVRYELAYGGESRINLNDPQAKRLRKKDRLPAAQTGEQVESAESESSLPAAVTAFESNAVGRGYAAPWYLRATGRKRMPAPQVEPPEIPFTVAKFIRAQKSKSHNPKLVSELVAGLGVRAKAHPERRTLCGTIDQRFAESAAWLPEDFDFGVWNAAPPDQQTEFLKGDEWVELTNLCAPNSQGARKNNAGDTVLPLKLPGHCATLLVRMQNGTMFFHPMKIDTLILEPEEQKVSVIWRTVLEKTGEIRAVEANLHKEFEAAFTGHIDAELNRTAVDDLLASLTLPQEEHHG